MSKKHTIIRHRYIDENPIKEDSKALILGTIYPCKCDSDDKNEQKEPTYWFDTDFFYGNKYSLWDMLKTAFPKLDIYSKEEIDGKYKLNSEDMEVYEESAEKIKAMLDENHIAISDVVKIAKREDCQDCSADSFDDKVTQYNKDLVGQIKGSKIKTVYFTSIEAYNLFETKILNRKALGKKSGDEFEISIDDYAHNPIYCYILPSPSSSANRSASKTEWFKNAQKQNPDITVAEARKQYYIDAFKKYLGE